MYDLKTKRETQITIDSHAQVHASIFGDYIVWLDNRHGDKSIYLYQISTREEKKIWSSSEQVH
jgi:beta propeller repeat protein